MYLKTLNMLNQHISCVDKAFNSRLSPNIYVFDHTVNGVWPVYLDLWVFAALWWSLRELQYINQVCVDAEKHPLNQHFRCLFSNPCDQTIDCMSNWYY